MLKNHHSNQRRSASVKLAAFTCSRTASLALILGLLSVTWMPPNAVAAPSDPHPDIASTPGLPKADPADVSSILDTVKAFYSAISAPAGGKLDRQRLRSLFVPSGRIVVGIPPGGTHLADVVFLSLDQYADGSDAQTAKEGFFDRNPANEVEQFGVMAHVYSTYESRANPEEANPTARGIKSFELLHRADRWYIVQVYWDSERPENPLPERYLHDNAP